MISFLLLYFNKFTQPTLSQVENKQFYGKLSVTTFLHKSNRHKLHNMSSTLAIFTIYQHGCSRSAQDDINTQLWLMLINYDGFVSLFPSTGMISSIKTRIVIRRKTWDQGSHFRAHICSTNHFDRHTLNAFWKDLYSAF